MRPQALQSGACLRLPLLPLFLADIVSAYSTPPLDDFTNDDIDCYMIAMETTVGSEGSRAQPSTSLPPVSQPSHDLAPPSEEEEEEEEEAEPSTVPGTPPPKKVGAGGWGGNCEEKEQSSSQTNSAFSLLFSFQFRSLFFGSILAPVHSPQGPSPVLAEDSDGEG